MVVVATYEHSATYEVDPSRRRRPNYGPLAHSTPSDNYRASKAARSATQPLTSTRCTICRVCRGPPGEHRGYPKSQPFRLASLQLDDSIIDSETIQKLEEISLISSDWSKDTTITFLPRRTRCEHEHAQWCLQGRREEDGELTEMETPTVQRTINGKFHSSMSIMGK